LFLSEDIRAELKQEENETNSTSAALPLPRNYSTNVINAEKYYLPFELACQCSVPRVVVIALDCLQVNYFKSIISSINEKLNYSYVL
jgi:brefeldin A-inhibited guanine nucleotide-exchange protein